MTHRKKLNEGFAERMATLNKVLPGAKEMVDSALERYKRGEVARDDIVDALVAVATAAGAKDDLRTLPERPTRDSKGLPMEIVYSITNLPDKHGR